MEVTDQSSIDEAVRRVGAQMDGLEMLINNASIPLGGVAAREAHSSWFVALEAPVMMEVFQVSMGAFFNWDGMHVPC